MKASSDHRFLLRVFNSLSPHRLSWLATSDTFEGLSVLCLDSKSCRKATPADCSWLVASYLAQHQVKFRTMDARLPDVRAISLALAVVEDKLRWNWYFRNEPNRNVVRHLRESRISSCSFSNIPPEVDSFSRRFRSYVFEACSKQVALMHGRKRWWCNSSFADRLAIRELRASGYFVIKSDKGGNYVLVKDLILS